MSFGIVVSKRVTAHYSTGVLVYGGMSEGYLDCPRWKEIVAILAECAGDCADEVISEIEVAICLMKSELFANLVNGRCKEWKEFNGRWTVSLEEYRKVEEKYLDQAERRVAKRHHTKIRRREFNACRSDLFLKMIDAGIGFKCAAIGCTNARDLTVDHIVPLSRGGTDQLSNLQFLCRSHNSKKGDTVRPSLSDPSGLYPESMVVMPGGQRLNSANGGDAA